MKQIKYRALAAIRSYCLPTVALASFLFGASPVLSSHAKSSPPTQEYQPYTLDTGKQTNDTADGVVAFKSVIKAANDPSKVRVHFSSFNLGKSSYMTLTSVRDGGRQKLDTTSMGYWQNTSAIFNGDQILLELHVAPGDQGIFAQVDQLINECNCSGEALNVSAAQLARSLCGADNRVASTDNRVGRISGCTAWLVSNGAVLTAGHCGVVSGVFEANVPASSSSGVTVASAPENQYPINTSNRTAVDNGQGDDYGVFGLLPNSTTGTRAHQRFGFFRMTRELPTAGDTIRITGFGVDNTPAGPVSNCCARNTSGTCTHADCNGQSRTLQTSTGDYVGETVDASSDIFHTYQTDTEPANSGSPIIWNTAGYTIGIHTHGGCSSGGGANSGTSFENNNLEIRLQGFLGSNTEYVDLTQPPNSPTENGTIFQPFNTVTEAVSSVVSGGRVAIVEGSYTKAAGNTMVMGTDGKSFLMLAPVGTVTIGN